MSFLYGVVVLLSVAECSDISSAHFGTFDFLELDSTAYEVEISSAPVSELQLQGKVEREGGQDDDGKMYMSILSKHGQLYSCSLPPPPDTTEGEGEETGHSVDTLPNITTLLKPLAQQECLIKTVGWWTYEYCHGNFIRQYHMEAGKIVGETKYLGFYANETVWDQEYITRIKGLLDSFKGNLDGLNTRAYHIVYFTNGTECDITHQPRNAKIEVYCALEGVDQLVEVKEDSVCNYTLAVHTPLLCQHPMMVPLGKSARSKTLSCTPVVSQLDYEDYRLKQELIRQQKEKLRVIQGDDTSERGSEREAERDSLLSADHQFLKSLVMASITQLAEIAYEAGEFDSDREQEIENVISDNDKEVGGSRLKSSDHGGDGNLVGGRGRGSKGEVQEEGEESDGDQKVSDKMKKMAKSVKKTGRDSALESLLSNLAVTAEYIESLDSDTETDESSSDDDSEMSSSDETTSLETGEPEEGYGETRGDKDTLSSTAPGREALVGGRHKTTGKPTSSDDLENDSGREETGAESSRGGIAREMLSALEVDREVEGEEEEEEEEEFDVDSELVREMEQQLEETLARQLDTKDITVKIISLPDEDIGDDREGMEGRGEGDVGEDDNSDLSDVMSRLLESLLSGEEPEPEDKQRQSRLETEYDRVWGQSQNGRRKSGR